jgi:hypothetical protein
MDLRRTCSVATWGVAVVLSVSGQNQSRASEAVIEQTEYWAKPGKAEEVYQWRLHACDVREQIGLQRGRVFRRQESSETLPDVVWQIEYPNEAARLKDLKARDGSPEFMAVREHMNTLTTHFERGLWRPN